MIRSVSPFLLPAGLLPPVMPLSMFFSYEELRLGKDKNTSPLAGGYEYYYMVEQDPYIINQSEIGGKISVVHGPWTNAYSSPSWKTRLLTTLIFTPKVGKNHLDSARKTLEFAGKVGAKRVILHTADLDLSAPKKFMTELNFLAKKLGIEILLEHEILHTFNFVKGNPTINRWLVDPAETYRKFGNRIVFDPASLVVGEELLCWEKLERISKGNINEVVGEIHINEWIPHLNIDQGQIKSPVYITLIKRIFASGYTGHFTFEIGPIQNRFDYFLIAVYAGYCLCGLNIVFPFFQKWFARHTQKYLRETIEKVAEIIHEQQ